MPGWRVDSTGRQEAGVPLSPTTRASYGGQIPLSAVGRRPGRGCRLWLRAEGSNPHAPLDYYANERPTCSLCSSELRRKRGARLMTGARVGGPVRDELQLAGGPAGTPPPPPPQRALAATQGLTGPALTLTPPRGNAPFGASSECPALWMSPA